MAKNPDEYTIRAQMEVEWGKLGLCVLILAMGFALILTHNNETVGVSMMTTVMGYVFGNGRLVSKGQVTVPMLGVRQGEQPPAQPPAA